MICTFEPPGIENKSRENQSCIYMYFKYNNEFALNNKCSNIEWNDIYTYTYLHRLKANIMEGYRK